MTAAQVFDVLSVLLTRLSKKSDALQELSEGLAAREIPMSNTITAEALASAAGIAMAYERALGLDSGIGEKLMSLAAKSFQLNMKEQFS